VLECLYDGYLLSRIVRLDAEIRSQKCQL